ncbi:MAG: NADH-dependent dehydrogenase [Planctomycetota bacterium]|nr:MAG: NADH-dependent dehydrogenase [Planctomycetota bacterium]
MTNRRTFLKRAAVAGLAATVLPLAGCASAPRLMTAGTRMRHACVGVGGMGGADLNHFGAHPDVDIVALCDVDSRTLAKAAAQFPTARVYADWRSLLDAERGQLDSLNVSTPDHMHAPIALAAMRQRLHVYCQKPLSHTVREARLMAKAARHYRVVTQMGIQNHSGVNFRRAHEILKRGDTGPIHEVHVWTDRPAGWWAQGQERPTGSDAIPAELDWNGWLGVAPRRPYKEGKYHAFSWRGVKDFGTGAQGDMGCHLMDPVPWFLGLTTPLSIRSEGPAPNAESFPEWSEVHYEFAAGNAACHPDGVHVVWHDGGRKPDALLAEWGAGDAVYANAALLVGDEAALIASPYDDARLLTRQGERPLQLPDLPEIHHWHNWVEACFGREAPRTPFAYSAPLTETALLGNIALEYPGETLRWHAESMRFLDKPEADALLHKRYRRGWELPRI